MISPIPTTRRFMTTIGLKYGLNPHQTTQSLLTKNESFKLLNGTPSLTNMLDAYFSYGLVHDLHTCFYNEPEFYLSESCASFKHNSPAGVALGTPLNLFQKKSIFASKKKTKFNRLFSSN